MILSNNLKIRRINPLCGLAEILHSIIVLVTGFVFVAFADQIAYMITGISK